MRGPGIDCGPGLRALRKWSVALAHVRACLRVPVGGVVRMGQSALACAVCVDPGLRLLAAFPYAAESSAWVLHTRVRNAMWAALRGSPPRIRLSTAGGFINMRVHHVTKMGCASRQPPRKPF